MALTIYWTDDQLNRWSEADGVTSYAPPGGPDSGDTTAVALFCAVTDSGIAAFGVTERVGGTTDALGWRTTDALVETNDFWVPEDGSGDWTLPGGDVVEGYFITAYEGAGATFDPVTGYIFLTGIFRRFAMPGYDPVAEHSVLVIDPATDTIVDSAVESFVDPYLYEPSGAGDSAGQCVLGRKLYYLGGNDESIIEFDMDTYEVRVANYCLEHNRSADLKARPGDATGLWIPDTQGWDSPYDLLLQRFEVEDIPWFEGTTALDGVPAVPSETIVLFRDDYAAPAASNLNVLHFVSANEVVYQAESTVNGNLGWYRQTIDPLGDPELLVDLGDDWFDDHSEAYSMWLPEELPPPSLIGNITVRRHNFWRTAPSQGQSNG